MHELRNYIYALDETDEDSDEPNQFNNLDLTDHCKNESDIMKFQPVEINENYTKEEKAQFEIETKEKLENDNIQNCKFVKFKVC